MISSVTKNIVAIGSSRADSLPLSPSNLDVGFGCPVVQSSTLSQETRASALYPSSTPGSWSFHTEMERDPHLTVDLRRVRTIGQIRLWNREDAGQDGIDRIAPFKITSSIDGHAWNELVTWTESFGGRSNAMPFLIVFVQNTNLRFVRIELVGTRYLHLDYIEILQFVPKIDWGCYYSLTKRLDAVTCTYLHRFNTGLYSGCSTALHDIIRLGKSGIIAERIDLTTSFKFFKDRHDEDAFPLLFVNKSITVPDQDVIRHCRTIEFDCHDVHRAYKDLPLRDLQALIQIYFHPSAAVLESVDALLGQTGIDPEATIALVYRGTDKGTEVRLASIDAYIDVASSIKATNPHLKVLVQTDQQQARDRVIERFGEDTIYFADLPVTAGDTVIHKLSDLHTAAGRTAFSTKLMAAVLIASRCKHLVLHTGNVGAWIAFYRGNSENLHQFGANGELVPA